MKSNHLSAWEQEEYVLRQRTPQMLHHLNECAECRAGVARLEQGVNVFRGAAMEWSAQCLATRPQPVQFASMKRLSLVAMRWAFAAMIPLVVLAIALLGFRPSSPPRPPSGITDDALLQQVDEQVSVAVPSSMESLTHLVTTESSSVAAVQGNKPIVQKN